MTNYGQRAYESYCATTGGRSAINGAKLPTWDELRADPTKTQVTQAWEAAGLAAAKVFVESVKQAFNDEVMTLEAAAVAKVAVQHGENALSAFGKGYAAMLVGHAEREGILL